MSELSEFEELLIPLDIMTSTVFNEHVKYELVKLYHSHREDILISNVSLAAQETIISTNVKLILMQLSRGYVKKLLTYYSNDGLVLYVMSCLKKLIYSDLSSRLENGNSNKQTSTRLTLTD